MPGGGLRQTMRELAHRPLQGEIAQRFLWLLGLPADGCVEKGNQGVHNRFVLQAHVTTLPHLARDRGNILKGLTETDESWRQRIYRAPNSWRVAGSAWAVLEQILGYVLSSTPAARTVSTRYEADGTPESTQWDYYDAGDDTTKAPKHLAASTPEWDWDSLSPTRGSWGWWRWYLVIEAVAPNEWIGTQLGPLGDAAYPKLGSLIGAMGVSRPKEVCRSIQIIIGQWKSGWSHWVIISFDAAKFIPGAATVDGTYGHWSKVVSRVHVRSRDDDGRYFRGQYRR